MKTPLFSLIFCLFVSICYSQNSYPEKPENAEFISTDISRFWEAFDKIEQGGNPFKEYLDNGSQGLQDFIEYRIESPRNLLKTAKKKRQDYEAIRENSYKMDSCISQISTYYSNFEEIYSNAVYPPTYFVIGAFYEKRKTDFGHYFRNLYRIFKLIDDTKIISYEELGLYRLKPQEVKNYNEINFKIQYKYTSIIRA